MVGLTLVYEGSGSLPKLQIVHGLRHLRSCLKTVCKMSRYEQDYDTSSTCTIHTVVLVSNSSSCYLSVCQLWNCKVFQFLISKLFYPKATPLWLLQWEMQTRPWI